MGIAEGFKVEVVDVTGDAAMMAQVGRLKAEVAALTAALREIARESASLAWANQIAEDALDAAAGGA
jgi:hypothetical protein